MKKLIILMFCMLIFLIGNVSALKFDNVKLYDEEIKEITIVNAFNIPLIRSDIAKYKLTYNTDQCLINCYAEGTAILYKDGELFSDLRFKDRGDNWIDIKESQIYIEVTEEISFENPVYETECKAVEDCIVTKTTYETIYEDKTYWKEYNFEELESGTYKWRIEGKKNIHESVDWIGSAFGKELTEWDWWDGNWARVKNVNITGGTIALTDFPALVNITNESEMQAGFDDIRFVNGTCSGVQDTELSYEFDRVINGSSALAFINIPVLNTGTNQICMYYDNAGASNGEDASGTWIGYVGVFLFSECEGITTRDSVTGNSFSFTGDPAWVDSNSSLGCALGFDGDDRINLPNASISMDVTSRPVAVETQMITPDISVARSMIGSDGAGYDFGLQTSKVRFAHSGLLTVPGGTALSSDTEYFIQVSHIVNTVSHFYNKNADGTGAMASGYSVANYDIARGYVDDWYWTGTLDHILVSNVTRSHAWFNRSYDNRDYSFFAFGEEGTAALVTTTLDSPIDSFNSSSDSINFAINSSSIDMNLSNITLYIWYSNSSLYLTNFTSLSGNETITSNWTITNIPDGNFVWNALTRGDLDNAWAENNRSFIIDIIAPSINITSPPGIINYHTPGTNLTLNWTVSDTHLESCWYNYNSTNINITCSDNSTQFTVTEYSNRNLTFYSNDSFGNEGLNFTSWDYKVFQKNVTYSNVTTEGATEIFELNFTQGQGFQASTITLVYNNTDYSSTFVITGNEVIATNTIIVPNQNSITDVLFYWSILMDDNSIINTTRYNQTVNILQVDDCAAYTNLIYNYTLLDEENQTKISANTSNVSIELQLNLYDISKKNLVLNFSAAYIVNPVQVCFNTSLLNNVNYSLDSVVKYTADNYTNEYYNILGYILTNSTVPNHIYLYGLLSEDSTDFQLTFRDESLSLAANVIIHVYRQYVSDNDFKIVEAPLTDSNGQTVLHLVRNDIIYNFIMKDSTGTTLATFNRIIAFCADYTIGSCEIELSAAGEGDFFYDHLDDVGISYTTSYSNVTELISFNFVTDDLTSKTIQMDVLRNSDFGNRTVCQESLTSASGLITCDVSAITSTDRYLFISISVDGDLKAESTVDLESEGFEFGAVGPFIAFFILLAFILMFMGDKQTLIISIVFGWIAVISFGLVKGVVVGALSGTIWLIVTAIIILWKLRKEDR